ncbi:FUSC family protein [Streptomyces arenae]|nr:FUSC family protein [Streptomyces arenae]
MRTPGRPLRLEVRAIARSARRAVTPVSPERRTTSVQALKAAGAALVAWTLAGWWWQAPMAILAPWTALVLMHHTVYRSLHSAVRQFVVVAAGTVIAAAAAALTHDVLAAMAVAMPLTVLIGTYGRLGEEGWYAPTAALFVLTYGSFTGTQIVHRLLETLLGAVIGVLVNALVLPPVHTVAARRLQAQVPAQCAALVTEVAYGIEAGYDAADAEDWYARALRLGTTVAELRAAQRHADESRRLNPARRIRRSPPLPVPSDVSWDRVTDHLATVLRSLAETTHEEPRFAAPPDLALTELASLLRSMGVWCAADAGRDDTDRSRRALTEARSAGRRLASLLDDPLHGTTASLGELTAATTRLLDDLEPRTS